VTGRGYLGNRFSCAGEDQLRQHLTWDGVSFDDVHLAAALSRLETATLPGSDSRLIRGSGLHRRNSSLHLPAAQLPPRAMLLEHMHPFDYKVYEPADISPYLV
jgi:hypothetical protein